MSVLIAPTYQRAAPTWWKAPQRLWLRRAIFQVHLWVGVLLTLYVVVIGLSGSALVFNEEIEEAMHGDSIRVSPQVPSTSLNNAVRAIAANRPGFTGIGLENLDRPDKAVVLLMRPKNEKSKSENRLVLFNPYTGKVLLDQPRYAGVMGWLANLHYYLLFGGPGLLVSGYMAIGLLLLCASGLVLWWPGVRRWASSLTLRRRARWQRLNWDLHSVVGFWSCAALSAVTFTGIYFAFPAPVRSIFVWSDSKPTAEPVIKTTQAPVMTIDEALKAAKRALPADAPPSYLQLPATSASPYKVTGYYANTAPYSQLVQVTLDPRTGALLASDDTRRQPIGLRLIQYFFTVHAGSFGGKGAVGLAVKIIWVALGITPALLGVTGLLMYWNRKLRPLLLNFGKRAPSTVHARR